MKLIRLLPLPGAILAACGLAQAQGTQPDPAVPLALQACPALSADAVPRFGTFFSLQHPEWPPKPADTIGVPCWSLGSNAFVLNDVDFNYSPPSPAMGAGRFSLAAGFDAPSPPGGGGAGGGGGDSPGYYVIPTNGLWLQITNLADGLAYVNLNNATNLVYEILSKTDLNLTNWTIEQELWPTNPVAMPFVVPQSNRTNLYLWAMDWTGVSWGTNAVPSWWTWRYYGTTELSDTNLDSQGNTLLYDYQNGLDPNVIGFSIATTNNYVSASTPTVQLSVSQGVPSFAAVLVDSTNFDGANWNAYTSSNVTVNLGTTEGWHDVWIGLRGLPANAVQTWQWKRLKLDRTPPALVLTGPASVVSQSLVQLTGYSPESLRQIAYDLTNANGLLTNQQVLVLDQHYDTNTLEFSTNTFQAFDVALAPGTNFFTLHAADLAGNATSATFTLTLAGDTDAPVVNVVWPQDGMQLCGSAFTVFGTVDDASASLTATLVDANGNTNTFNALIERNGKFWLEDLPLTAGSNWLTLSAVDIWGNTSTTNLTVTQSSLGLTVDSIDDSQLYLPAINLTGTVGDAACAIWANGVQGTNNGDGTWSATNVPVTSGGTARFTVSAYPPGDSISANLASPQLNPSDTNAPATATNVDKPMRLYVESYFEPRSYADHVIAIYGNGQRYEGNVTGTGYGLWKDGAGGAATMQFKSVWSSPTSGGQRTNTCIMEQDFYPSYYPALLPGPTPDPCSDTYPLPVALAWQHAEVITRQDYSVTNRDGDYYFEHIVDKFSAQAKIKLYTGGKAGINRQNLWAVSGAATEHRQIDVTGPFNTTVWTNVPVPPGQITMGQLGKLGSDGIRWTTLPDDTTKDITPVVKGLKWYDFDAGAQEYKLHILANDYPLAEDRVRPLAYYCVGQKLNFEGKFSPDVPGLDYTSSIWNYTADYVNNHYTSISSNCEIYNIAPVPSMSNPTKAWFYNQQTQDVDANLGIFCQFTNGQSAHVAGKGKFNVFTPSIIFITNSSSATVNIRRLGIAAVLGIGAEGGGEDMEFHAKIVSIPKFQGQAVMTQLINRQSFIDGIPFTGTGGGFDLDNSEIYPNPVSVTNDPAHPLPFIYGILDLYDRPAISIQLASWASCNDHFKTYFRFKPDGDGDNIYVTLGRTDWNWFGNADYTGYNPASLDSWTITSSGVGGPDFYRVKEFPVWNAIYSNLGF